MRRPGSGRDQRGAVASELVVLLPVMALVIGLLVAGGRIHLTRQAVVDAAAAGARSASLSRTVAEARQDAEAAVRSNLDTAGVSCTGLRIEVDTSGFAVAVGLPAEIRTQVRCTVDLSDAVVPGLPGSMVVSADAASALDTYRGR